MKKTIVSALAATGLIAIALITGNVFAEESGNTGTDKVQVCIEKICQPKYERCINAHGSINECHEEYEKCTRDCLNTY